MRIAIVNDVLLAIEAMRRTVSAAPQHQVAWTARDGAEALARCRTDRPDLILMDLIMPNMDGVEATRRIMSACPCPIVVVTADVTTNSSRVFDALGAGALDAVNTPALESPESAGARALLAKIETIGKLVGHAGPRSSQEGQVVAKGDGSGSDPCLIAMGASAGGPAALARVLGVLKAEFQGSIVVVQHVDAQFAGGLADWLNHHSPLQVQLVREGDRPQPGTVLVAGRESHLVFTSPSRLGYSALPEDGPYCPSIDVFFQSAIRLWRGKLIGVLLTGMGRDGAEGLLSMRRAGHHTIAQDCASSAVYGMPKAAADLKAAVEILPLDQIGPRLVVLTQHQRSSVQR